MWTRQCFYLGPDVLEFEEYLQVQSPAALALAKRYDSEDIHAEGIACLEYPDNGEWKAYLDSVGPNTSRMVPQDNLQPVAKM